MSDSRDLSAQSWPAFRPSVYSTGVQAAGWTAYTPAWQETMGYGDGQYGDGEYGFFLSFVPQLLGEAAGKMAYEDTPDPEPGAETTFAQDVKAWVTPEPAASAAAGPAGGATAPGAPLPEEKKSLLPVIGLVGAVVGFAGLLAAIHHYKSQDEED